VTRESPSAGLLFETLAIALPRRLIVRCCRCFSPTRYFGHDAASQKRPASDKRDGPEKRHNQLLQASEPSINLFAGLIFGVAVPLLQTTLQLVALAVDRSEIIVSEFSAQPHPPALDIWERLNWAVH
jgi:hypothetical protein